jgi:hypothetical protein
MSIVTPVFFMQPTSGGRGAISASFIAGSRSTHCVHSGRCFGAGRIYSLLRTGCHYEQRGFVAWIIATIALAGAITAAFFYGVDLTSILRGNANKDSSLGGSAIKLAAAIMVGTVAIIATNGGAVVGVVLIVLYFWLSGRRRRW